MENRQLIQYMNVQEYIIHNILCTKFPDKQLSEKNCFSSYSANCFDDQKNEETTCDLSRIKFPHPHS